MSEMKLGWLFPNTLYLHGERGNILALERFGKMAGMDVKTEIIDFNTSDFDPMNYDVIFCPPGEISSFPQVIQWLRPYREKFQEYIEGGKPLIVTGTSVAMWGEIINRFDGTEFSGLGIIKMVSKENESVYGDDIYFTCKYNGKEIEVIGNQIQMADFINQGEGEFGHLNYGYGNTGKDREEGFMIKNSIFTNTLGPMLVVTPELTMEIIKVVGKNKEIELNDFNFDTQLEEKSFATKKEFIITKNSNLTNCK